MEKRTLQEWGEYYKKHCGYPEGCNQPGDCPAGSKLYWDEAHGYVVLRKDDDMMIVEEVCGDLLYWLDFARRRAISEGCDKLGGVTGRHIKAGLRRFGAEILSVTTDKNNFKRYTCRKNNELIIASEGVMVNRKVYNATPFRMYAVTWYLGKKVEV